MQSISRSNLFTSYNAAKSIGIERGRLNRALGLAQTNKAPRPYITTPVSCTCADFRYRHVRCKHMISLALVTTAESL